MVEELMSESLNYSRYVEETASDPARDTHQELAIHSESRKKGATTFSIGYCEMFPSNDLKKIKTRAMYGNPFHSIIAHMADLYRIISLRSINTEGYGRTFFEY